ncbi:protein big brother-like [Limulus polyphemus]|uniref:Protein big brother-like n=1 Tax=Limulus polyphemus TaxID=6850 RepID=A0ABM1SK80_LIMPO|nr:protein big brother-like [Limulus polyphemus]
MLPFEAPVMCDQLSNCVWKVPRVVADQKTRFESDDLLRKLQQESEAFLATGINLPLVFNPCTKGYGEGCDFEREKGKVHIVSRFIMNGVCVRWRGWLDLHQLDGIGYLEYDEEQAQVEQAMLKEQFQLYNRRLKEFEEKQRAYHRRQERHLSHQIEPQNKRTEFNPKSMSASNV